MKRQFTLAFIVITVFSAHAQLAVNDTLLTMSGNLSGEKHTFTTNLHNNSTDTMELEWSRMDLDMPGNWYAQICTDILCYDSSDTWGQFYPLAPGDSVPIIAYIYDDLNTSGDGSIKVAVYNGRDSLNSHVVVRFKYSGTPTGIKEFSRKIAAYPNPFKKHVIIDLRNVDLPYTSFQITSISGKILRNEAVAITTEQINLDLAEIPGGIYFMTIKNGDEVILRKQLIKQ